MNKYIFIFLFFANQLFASTDSIVVSRCYSMYDGVSTGYSYSVDRYDSVGNFLSNNLIQSTLNNTPYIKQRTTRVLNQFGNPVSSLAETWNGSDWDSTSAHFYVYDNARNLIADTLINYINNSSSLTLYDWDLNNDTLAVKHLYFPSGNYQFGDSTHYLFNVNGLIDTYESYYGVTLDPVSRKSYFYDASNRVISYTTQIDTGSGWENSQQFLYSYDVSNRLTGYSYRNWVGTYWDVIDTSNYFFTPSGKIDHSMVSQFSGCCPDSILTFNTYDASDSLTQIDCFKFWFPSNTSDSSRTVYLRDANGYVTDSYEMRALNGVYHNTGLYHHDLSLLPDTDRVYYMFCDSVACTDTSEFIIYSYFP